MKTIKIFLILPILAFISCSKDELANPEPLLASVNVVNAATDQNTILVNKYGDAIDYSKLSNDIYFQGATSFGLAAGNLPFTVVSGDGTDKVLYNADLELKPTKMYSLFIAGDAAKRENFLFEETEIPRYKDSLIGVRVINLSADGPAFNVNTTSTPDTIEFSDVKYGTKTNFKSFAMNAQAAANGVGFEIRDPQTNDVLASYYLTQWGWPISTKSIRFKSMTLVVCGSLSAMPFTNEYYTVFAVPNY